ncbi:MAG: serine hydrolase family protein [Verrucomicrobiaceae bacterium]|nr:serine hydrolase family protein [Verrucomicrobiaceae bacterium]
MSGVLIIPGLRNSGPQHWQTVWQKRLPNAERIRMKQWDTPDLQQWVDATIAAVRKYRPSYLVAHSFGCLATAHALDAIKDQIRGVLLVAPADPDKFDIAELLPHSPLPVPGLVVGSLTDPWLSWNKAQQWAQRWLLPIICAGDAGHINAESGHSDWQEGWELLQRLQQRDVSRRELPRVDLARAELARSRPLSPRLAFSY